MNLDNHEVRLLADYIGENWADFARYAQERGYNEDDADEIYNKL